MSHTVSGQPTNYSWDVASSLPVALQDGRNTYVYGLDLISATDGAGAQTYFGYDGLGSVTDLADGSGTVNAAYSYDVFGAIRSQTGSSPNYWLFTGEQRDSDSSFYYLRARYYDPVIGRFLGRDPAGAGHPYAYAENNPANYVDPSGLLFHKKAWDCAKDPIKCGKDAVEEVWDSLEDAFGPPWSVTKIVQILDVLPLQAACPLFGGTSIVLGPVGVTGAVACGIVVSGINFVAYGTTMYAIWTSDCGLDTKAVASVLNTGNVVFDNPLPGYYTFPIEVGLYVATNEMLKCKE